MASTSLMPMSLYFTYFVSAVVSKPCRTPPTGSAPGSRSCPVHYRDQGSVLGPSLTTGIMIDTVCGAGCAITPDLLYDRDELIEHHEGPLPH